MDSTPGSVPDPILSFDDTAVAFAGKSDAELMRTWKTFRKINSPFLSKVGPWLVTLAFKLRLPVEGIVRRTIFDVFCGGTSLADTVKKQEELNRGKVKTILDYSVEGEKTEEGFDATAKEIILTVEHAAHHDAAVFSALKVTGIARFALLEKLQRGEALSADETQEAARAKKRLLSICESASRLKQAVFIDAEETWVQNTIDLWTEEMMVLFNKETPIVFQTAQLYRVDRLAYLDKLIGKAKAEGFIAAVKIVRGAYLEKENARAKELNYPSPIQKDKTATDRDFDSALRLCVANHAHVALCAGTHNEHSSLLLTQLLKEACVSKDNPRFWFAQLLGMSDNISFNLAHAGYNTAKYLPYGPVRAVMPYLLRRAAENTSIAGQSSRELKLLEKEMKRRGLM
jgi:proline dehydrogenase